MIEYLNSILLRDLEEVSKDKPNEKEKIVLLKIIENTKNNQKILEDLKGGKNV